MIENRTEQSSSCLGAPVQYDALSSKEQEAYNAAHLMGVMACRGYLESFKINGDKHGADLLFYRSSDTHVLKVQLKGRPTLGKEYEGKDLHIAYPDRKNDCWYIYPHDVVMQATLDLGKMAGTVSWEIAGLYSWGGPPKWMGDILSPYRVQK